MRKKTGWILISAIALGLLFGSDVRATPLIDPPLISFGSGNDVGASSSYISVVALGDLDNDGNLDIVSGSGFADSEIIAWRNDGSPYNGHWTPNGMGSSSIIDSIAVGDLDNDGDLDVVTGDSMGEVTAWENYGSPFSAPWGSYQEVGTLGYSAKVALGDLNNDGYLDVVCGTDNIEDNQVVVFGNDHTPFNNAWFRNDVGVTTTSVTSVAVGDLDHDGYLDIVSGTHGGEDYEVIAWRNDHSPFFGFWTSNDVGTHNDSVQSVALGDLDQDGDLDIVSGSDKDSDSEVDAWENDGTPFSGLWNHNGEITTWNSRISSVALGDLDNDGDLDIVASSSWSDSMMEVASFQNDGTPFSDDWTMNIVSDSTDDVNSVAIGDLDNDGDLDVVLGSDSAEDYEIIAFPNTLVHRELHLGFPSNPVGTRVASVYSVAAGDLDTDGDLDLVSVSGGEENYDIVAWQNDTTPFIGAWTPSDVGATTYTWFSVALGDLDHDGDLDIVSVGTNYEIMVWKNDGTPFDGTWIHNEAGISDSPVFDVQLGDLDHDGDLDLSTVNGIAEDYEVIVWRNDGSPFIDPWLQNDVGASSADVNALALGDMGNDGDLDIVTGSANNEDFELILWESDGSPFTGLWIQHDIGATDATITSVKLGDLDNDGALDVVSSGGQTGDNEVIAWQNDGTPFNGLWTPNRVGISEMIISEVALGDIDNDGDLDIASVMDTTAESEVVVWENDNTPFNGLSEKHLIGIAERNIYSVTAADLDHDGDLDLVTGSDNSALYEVIAWQNTENLFAFLPLVQKSNP